MQVIITENRLIDQYKQKIWSLQFPVSFNSALPPNHFSFPSNSDFTQLTGSNLYLSSHKQTDFLHLHRIPFAPRHNKKNKVSCSLNSKSHITSCYNLAPQFETSQAVMPFYLALSGHVINCGHNHAIQIMFQTSLILIGAPWCYICKTMLHT